jgi:hypothetical protein
MQKGELSHTNVNNFKDIQLIDVLSVQVYK